VKPVTRSAAIVGYDRSMGKLWFTYAWRDNEQQDVDYIAQEITGVAVEVRLDRWILRAGQRLWEQIDNSIRNPNECDAWAIYLTQNSLNSQPCLEELGYALDRALSERGQAFPLIGISPGGVDSSLIPGAIKTRLYVTTTDPDWKERVKAVVEGGHPRSSRRR
jgi:hypothetical protein